MRRLSRHTLGIVCAIAIAHAPGVAAQADSARGRRAASEVSSPFVALQPGGNGLAALERRVTLDLGRLALEEALRAIASAASVGLTYDPALPGLQRNVFVRVHDQPAARAFLSAVRGSGLELLVSTTGQTLLVRLASRSDEPDARGTIEGTVRETAGGAPVDNVRIEVVGARLGALTGVDGRFVVRGLPSGSYTLRALRLGFRAVDVPPVRVTAGERATVTLEMEPAPTPLAQVVVTPGYFGVLDQVMAAPQTLSREELERAPQLADDTFRAVNRLPGVASSDLTAAFRVRGGGNEELFMTLDGVQLYEPFHLKDFDAALSIIDIGALRGMELTTGGFGARYGDRLTGVFDMRTDDLSPGERRTTLALTLTNLRAATQGSFAGDRGEWLLSARHGYLEYALKLADANDDLSPKYYDILGKVRYRLGDAHSVSFHALHAGDRLNYLDEPSEPRVNSSYGSTYAWARWDADFTARLSARTVLSVGHLTWDRLGTHFSQLDGVQDASITEDREFTVGSLRQDWSFSLSERALLKWGVDARRLDASHDYLRWVRRLVGVNGELEGRFDTVSAAAKPHGTAVGAYVAQRLRPLGALTAELGVRYDRHGYLDEDRVSPRLNAALELGSRTTIRGAWGRYYQAQGVHELQVQDGVVDFYDPESAEHRVLGIEHLFAGGVQLRVEGYQRLLSDQRPRFTNLANELEVFAEMEDDRVLLSPTSGDLRGVELFARRDAAGRFAWTASYSFALAEDVIDGRDVPRSLDQRHTFYADVAYMPNRKWRLGAAWQYHSGWPYTPFTIVVEQIVPGVFATHRTFGALNSDRLPSYHRLDLRLLRSFDTRRGRVLAYLDLFNVYNRRNPRAAEVNLLSVEPVHITRSIDRQLPRFPSFGIIWEF